MDSGNSSSMQSSSGGGGDEEYDSVSRTDSIPAFNLLSNQHPSFFVHHQDQPTTLFDPSVNFLNPFSLSPPNSSSLMDFDEVRPRMSLRSEPNQSILGSQGLNQGSFPGQPVHEDGVRTSTQSDRTSVAKNPKKRTRASRRAPTTVLTTDTTNFRAMVQEFTGIPAPPFSGSSYSRRLDLFGSGSSLGSLYSLRPSAKRVHTAPFTSSPSLLNNPLLDAADTSNTAMANAFSPSSSNYQLPSDLGLLKQPQAQNLSNLQNQSQILSFQSFLDPPPLHPSLSSPGFGATVKSQGSSAAIASNPSINELGLSHGHGGLQSHLTPEAAHGVGLNDGNYGSNDHNQQRVNTCKLNYSATSSSAFHHDKGSVNVPPRAEGTVDSWICHAE